MERPETAVKKTRSDKHGFQPDPERRRVLTVPNLISVGRVFLLIPLFFFLRKGPDAHGNFWALVIMGIALLTDILDGLIARWFHVESDWGRVLDPLADKTWLGCLTLFLAMPWRAHPLPWEFVGLVLLRDAAIVGGAYYAFRKTGRVLTANVTGKISMGLVALTLIMYTIYWEPEFATWLRPENAMLAASIMLVISGLHYGYRMNRILCHGRTAPAATEKHTQD